MADDLVKRLNDLAPDIFDMPETRKAMHEAADLIEQQAASLAAKDKEIERLANRLSFEQRAVRVSQARAEQAERALAEATRLRPTDEWHEDLGDVLWWRIGDEGKPLETPWVGSPLSCGYTVEAHTTTRIISQINQESDPEPTIERISVGGWIDDYFTHFSEIPRAFVAQHGSDSREGK